MEQEVCVFLKMHSTREVTMSCWRLRKEEMHADISKEERDAASRLYDQMGFMFSTKSGSC